MKSIVDPLTHDILLYLEEHGNSKSKNVITGLGYNPDNATIIYAKLKHFEEMKLLTRKVTTDRSVYYWLTGLGINIADKIREIDELMEDV